MGVDLSACASDEYSNCLNGSGGGGGGMNSQAIKTEPYNNEYISFNFFSIEGGRNAKVYVDNLDFCKIYINLTGKAIPLKEDSSRNIDFLIYLGTPAPYGIFYLMCNLSFSQENIGKLIPLSSLNILTTHYGNKDYSGEWYGYEICKNYSNSPNRLSCENRISMDFVDVSNPTSSLRGNINLYILYDAYTKQIVQTDITGGIMVHSDETRFNTLESNQSLQNQRISALETWKQSIDDWKNGIATTITDILTTIKGNTNRITVLESQNTTPQNISNYFKYLSSSDRKNIVCGIATDNHLTTKTMQELGWKCDVTYRQSSSGERASCKCRKL